MLPDLRDLGVGTARTTLALTRFSSIAWRALWTRLSVWLATGATGGPVAGLRVARLLIHSLQLPRRFGKLLAELLSAGQIRRQLPRLVIAAAIRSRQRIGEPVECARHVLLGRGRALG